MTETDNPIVKEHLKLKDSQILKRIEEMDDNTREFQKMFESREIKPVVIMAYYDPTTQKYQFTNQPITKAQYSTTSLGTNTLSGPTTTTGLYKVVYAAFTNGTRNSTPLLGGTVGGTACASISAPGALGVQSRFWVFIGGTGPSAATSGSGLQGPIYLSKGDSLTMTDSAFQAADTMIYIWFYEVVRA